MIGIICVVIVIPIELYFLVNMLKDRKKLRLEYYKNELDNRDSVDRDIISNSDK